MPDHFLKGVFEKAPYIVKIFEKLDANERTASCTLNKSIPPKKEAQEKRLVVKPTNRFPL